EQQRAVPDRLVPRDADAAGELVGAGDAPALHGDSGGIAGRGPAGAMSATAARSARRTKLPIWSRTRRVVGSSTRVTSRALAPSVSTVVDSRTAPTPIMRTTMLPESSPRSARARETS